MRDLNAAAPLRRRPPPLELPSATSRNNEAEKKAKPRTKQIREPEREKTKTSCLVYLWVFADDGYSHRRRRKTEGKKTFQTPGFFWRF